MEVDMLDRRMIIVSHYLFNVSFFEIGLPTDYKSGYYWPQYL